MKKLINKLLFRIFNSPEYRKLNIHIVDDMIYHALLVKVALEEENYNIIKVFESGEDLMDDLKKNKNIDCIILDYKLSDDGLNGDDILNRIIIEYPDIKVIILSAQTSIEVAANVMKLGAYDYIIKNELANFNIVNKLSVLEDSINEKEKNKWLDKRVKFLYMLLLFLIWILSLVFLI